MINQGIKFN